MLAKGPHIVGGQQVLNVGIGTRVQYQLGGKEKFKATGVVVGVIPGEYLIFRVPAVPGILSRLNDGDSIVVRYVFAGNIYGFTSTIVTCAHKPVLMIFITFPEFVETLNLRKTRRVECLFPATVATKEGDFKAVIVDISFGGCRICMDYGMSALPSFEVDQTIELSFQLAGVAEEQVVNCTVKSLKRDTQLCEVGIQFDEKNEAVLEEVKQYISNIITDFIPA